MSMYLNVWLCPLRWMFLESYSGLPILCYSVTLLLDYNKCGQYTVTWEAPIYLIIKRKTLYLPSAACS